MSGIKTKKGVLGVDASIRRGKCEDVAAASIPSIGDLAASMGKSVGIISSARLTHATPAALYANAADRNFANDSKLPDGCTVPDVAAQLLGDMQNGMIDIALGGGRRNFIPKEFTDQEGKSGKRTDGRNMINEAESAGAQYAWDDASFSSLKLDHSSPILGLFASSHMMYEHDRTGEPSIDEMTQAAIKYLSNNTEGYFLLVEGGRVDHALHAGNAFRALVDGVVFDLSLIHI